jgi:hypothetical protein
MGRPPPAVLDPHGFEMGIGRQMDNWRYPEEGIWILRRLPRLPVIELTAGQILTAVNVHSGTAWRRTSRPDDAFNPNSREEEVPSAAHRRKTCRGQRHSMPSSEPSCTSRHCQIAIMCPDEAFSPGARSLIAWLSVHTSGCGLPRQGEAAGTWRLAGVLITAGIWKKLFGFDEEWLLSSSPN